MPLISLLLTLLLLAALTIAAAGWAAAWPLWPGLSRVFDRAALEFPRPIPIGRFQRRCLKVITSLESIGPQGTPIGPANVVLSVAPADGELAGGGVGWLVEALNEVMPSVAEARGWARPPRVDVQIDPLRAPGRPRGKASYSEPTQLDIDATMAAGGTRAFGVEFVPEHDRGDSSQVRRFTASADPTTIGRSKSTTVTVDVPTVSSQHCEVFLDGDHWAIRDVGSRNGTFVNGDRLDRGARRLESGDTVSLGRSATWKVRVHGP